ncbi:MAG: PAS domain S-box protein [Rhodospirillales bacterium]|nr:PAS domain S-box protein [Rhodospirillales bacterium]
MKGPLNRGELAVLAIVLPATALAFGWSQGWYDMASPPASGTLLTLLMGAFGLALTLLVLGLRRWRAINHRLKAAEAARHDLERRIAQADRDLQAECAERVRAEDAAREGEQRFAALIENAMESITVVDGAGNIRFQSPAVETMLGLKPAAMIGVSCFEFVHREDVARVQDAFVKGIQTPGIIVSMPFRVHHADGTWRWLEAIARNQLQDPAVLGVVINARDITPRRLAERDARRLENELAHLARLGTMGEMAAGFAHEINQPLTAIYSYARGCVRRLQAGSAPSREICEAMEATARQAERASEIIRRIRWFIRRDEPELTPIDINSVIGDALGLVKDEVRHAGIVVKTMLAEPLPWVRGDTIQLQQTVVALARAAIEAMACDRDGPRMLTLGTGHLATGEVEVSLLDTAPARPQDGRERLSAPLAAGPSRHAGIGLSVCRSIVERHGGRLSVAAHDQRGTTIRFTLRAFDMPAHPGHRAAASHDGTGDAAPAAS